MQYDQHSLALKQGNESFYQDIDAALDAVNDEITRCEVVDCINEAYGNKILQLGTVNTYNGTTSQGFTVQMFLDAAGKIKSAFPLGTGGH